MDFTKNTIIASTFALVGLFSSASEARISGDQIVPKTDAILAQAAQSPNAVFNQCVNDNFVMKKPGEIPPLLGKLYEKLTLQIAFGFIHDDATFAARTNVLLKQVCGDSQLADDRKR